MNWFHIVTCSYHGTIRFFLHLEFDIMRRLHASILQILAVTI